MVRKEIAQERLSHPVRAILFSLVFKTYEFPRHIPHGYERDHKDRPRELVERAPQETDVRSEAHPHTGDPRVTSRFEESREDPKIVYRVRHRDAGANRVGAREERSFAGYRIRPPSSVKGKLDERHVATK